MKALSVKQPSASYVAEGLKPIEIRSWATDHRGKLLIVASAAPKNIFFHDTEYNEHLLLPAGGIVGIVNLVDCRPMRKGDEKAAMCDFDPSVYAWVVEPITICRPVKILGKLHLYDVPDELIVPLKKSEWLWQFPMPQGDVKYTKACPVI